MGRGGGAVWAGGNLGADVAGSGEHAEVGVAQRDALRVHHVVRLPGAGHAGEHVLRGGQPPSPDQPDRPTPTRRIRQPRPVPASASRWRAVMMGVPRGTRGPPLPCES